MAITDQGIMMTSICEVFVSPIVLLIHNPDIFENNLNSLRMKEWKPASFLGHISSGVFAQLLPFVWLSNGILPQP